MFASKRSLAGWSVIVLCVGAGLFLVSCKYFTPQDVALMPPEIQGAEYVGMETCRTCHPKEYREFPGAPHAAFAVAEKPDAEQFAGEGCESCHGPGSLHVETRGDVSKIVKGDWKTCVRCHLTQRTKFQSRFHHPVPEGRLSCTDCHDPHQGREPVRWAEDLNETCFECHPDKKGPWAFPHDAVTEDGCTACHNPHGTNVDKMLVAEVETLCLRCHNQSDHPTIGGMGAHAFFIGRGGCHNCHKGIHGSNFSKHLRHE